MKKNNIIPSFGSLCLCDELEDAVIDIVSNKVAKAVVECLNSKTKNLSVLQEIQSKMPESSEMQQHIWHNVLFDEQYKRGLNEDYYDCIKNALCSESHFHVLNAVLDCNVSLNDKATLVKRVMSGSYSGSGILPFLEKVCPILPKADLKECFLKFFDSLYLCTQTDLPQIQQSLDVFFFETQKQEKKDWLNLSDKDASLRAGNSILNCFERVHSISDTRIANTLFLPLLQVGLNLKLNPNYRTEKDETFLHCMEEKILDYKSFFQQNPIDDTFQQARSLLLQAGADFRAEDQYGRRPYVLMHQYLDAVAIYVQFGAEVEYTNHHGRVVSFCRPNQSDIQELKQAIKKKNQEKIEWLQSWEQKKQELEKKLQQLKRADDKATRRISRWLSGIKTYSAEKSDHTHE